MKTVELFLGYLRETIAPLYRPENSGPSHDTAHVTRMIKTGSRIQGIAGFNGDPLQFSLAEFEAATWLHNLDRVRGYRGQNIEEICAGLLKISPFDEEARKRIIFAVANHSKHVKEVAGKSDLLTALQIADMVDRFSPSGIVGTGSHFSTMPLFDCENPWGFGDTGETKLRTIYEAWFRLLEWYGTLPSDEARALINPRFLSLVLEYVRCFGEEIANQLEVSNEVEGDIERALGSFYHQFQPTG